MTKLKITTSCMSFVAHLRDAKKQGRPRRTYNLLFVCRGHAQGHFPVEGALVTYHKSEISFGP